MQLYDIITPGALENLRLEGVLTLQAKNINGIPLTVYKLNNAATQWSRMHNLVIERNWDTVVGHAPRMVNKNHAVAPGMVITNVREYIDAPEGVIWMYNGKWGVAVEGEFDSPAALWAYDWLKARGFQPSVEGLNFRVVAPQFKRLVPYNYSGVVINGLIVHTTEYGVSDLRFQARAHQLRWTQFYRGLSSRNIQKAAAKRNDIAGFMVTHSVRSTVGARYFVPSNWYKQLEADAAERTVIAQEQQVIAPGATELLDLVHIFTSGGNTTTSW